MDTKDEKRTLFAGVVDKITKLLFRKRTVRYDSAPEENEVAVFACNHSGALGPAAMASWFDRPFRPWAISCIFDKTIVANYVYHDFFLGRAKRFKKFYRFLSSFVSKLLPKIIGARNPILVYRNSFKMRTTFSQSVDTLSSGTNVVVFPESPKKFSRFITTLYDGFVDIARFYYQKTQKILKFYPVYIPADLKTINVGTPIEYNPAANAGEERKRIAEYLTVNIDKIAQSLPTKKAIPFLKEEFYKLYSEFVDNPGAYWRFCENVRSE